MAKGPTTLVQRIVRSEAKDERRLLKLAAEAEHRGHVDAAVQALEKLATHYRDQRRLHKRIAVLARVVKLKPDDIGSLAALEETLREDGRAADADQIAKRRLSLEAPPTPVEVMEAPAPRREVVHIPHPELEDTLPSAPADDEAPTIGMMGIPPAAATEIDTHPPIPKVGTAGEETKQIDEDQLALLRRLSEL